VVATIIWKAKGFVLGNDRMAFGPDGDCDGDLGVEWNTRVCFVLGTAKGVSLVPVRLHVWWKDLGSGVSDVR